MDQNLTEDQIIEIVINDLICTMEMCLDEDNYVDAKKIMSVIELYMESTDFKNLVNKYNLTSTDNSDNIITVDEVINNEDGGADVVLTMSEDVKNTLISEGFKYIIIKSAIGNPSESEIIQKFKT
jgi:hypothetical protein